MTPNYLNRRVVADWLRGTSANCSHRESIRRNPGHNISRRKCCQLELRWSFAGGSSFVAVVAHSRAEATEKAAEWILRKGWEVTSA